MFDSFKKAMPDGIGPEPFSKDSIRSMTRKLTDRYRRKRTGADGQSGSSKKDNCKKTYERTKAGLNKGVERVVEKGLKKLDMPSRSDIEKIGRRLDELAEQIEKL